MIGILNVISCTCSVCEETLLRRGWQKGAVDIVAGWLPYLQDAFTDMKWVNLTANTAGKVAGFVDWGWGLSACVKSSCEGLNVPESTIYATMYEHAGDWDMAWDPDVHFVRSDDFFKTMVFKVSPAGGCLWQSVLYSCHYL